MRYGPRIAKLLGVSCAAILLLALGAGFITLRWWEAQTSCYNARPPLHSFVLTIKRSQQDQFIAQSKLFAQRNGFEFGIVYYRPDHQEFLIDLTRKDAEIITSNTSFDLDKYSTSFHNNNCAKPTTAGEIVGLVAGLKQYYLEMPGAQISEEK